MKFLPVLVSVVLIGVFAFFVKNKDYKLNDLVYIETQGGPSEIMATDIELAEPSSVIFRDTISPEDSVNQQRGIGQANQVRIGDGHSEANSRQVNILANLEKKINVSFQESYVTKQYQGRRSAQANMSHVIRGGGSSYRLMEFSRGLAGLVAMYEVTDDISYIEEAVDLTEQLITTTQVGRNVKNNPDSFRDDYLGWSNDNPTNRSDGGNHLEEVPLYESYLLRYVAKMVYLVNQSQSIPQNSSLRIRSEKVFQYVEKNGWEKWLVRGDKVSPGCFPFLFRSRTHMASHWAIVALYMRELTTDEKKREQYNQFLSLYDRSLKDNFRLDNTHKAYIWNMTWDKPWPFGTNCNPGQKNAIIQDVSHGNHVVTYIVEAYEMSDDVWKRDDINKLSNTLKYLVYDSKNVRFNGDLNGKFIANVANGLRLSDGFVKLARYDKSVLDIFQNVRNKQYQDSHFNFYEAQYTAEMLLAAKYHE